jgi:hypothetical protein
MRDFLRFQIGADAGLKSLGEIEVGHRRCLFCVKPNRSTTPSRGK